MGISRKLLPWAALAFGAALITAFGIPSYRQGEASVAGKTAEDFPIDLSGKPARLSSLRGKIVVLNFWATWCPPCVEETPSLNRLEAYIANKGGMVLGVSVDDDPEAYSKFIIDQHVSFATYRAVSKQIAAEYGTSMFPDTYIIDRRGRIARKVMGPQKWDSPEMLAYFDSLLAQN